jgi:ABC-type transporter Mla MlaB component
MADQFMWKAARDEQGRITYFLTGNITENSPIQKFAAEIQTFSGMTIHLDMSGLNEVNSSGIANWMKFIEFLKNNNIKVEFSNCSVTIVQQMNMVRQFSGGFKVASIFAPYFCPKCDAESIVKLDIPDGATSSIVDLKDNLPCGVCGEEKEFDDIAESYLSFLDLHQ